MKKYIFILFFIALAASGCKKFLDHQPDDRTEINGDPVKIAELVATAYPKASYIQFNEAMSDYAFDKGTNNYLESNAFPWQYRDQEGTDQDTPNFYWQACYQAIAAANTALDEIAKAGGGAVYNASKGEALVARAYAHFMLVTLFAKTYNEATSASDPGIPYVTEPESTVEGKRERGTVAGVYDLIEKDLLEGLPLIKNETYKGRQKWHFNTAAANAFAARFYLFKKKYEEVVKHADLAVPFSNVDILMRPWNTTYKNLGYYELQATFMSSDQSSNLLISEAATSWGGNFYMYNYGFETAGMNKLDASPIGGSLVYTSQLYGSAPEYYNIPKYKTHEVKTSINANTYYAYNMVNLFNVEEVMFNRAEANAMLGKNDEVVKELNAFLKTRSNSSSNPIIFTVAKAKTAFKDLSEKDAILNVILDFKAKEFLFEGLRWFDILRLNIPVEHRSADGRLNISLKADDPRRVLQLPKEVIAYGLAPNPR